ncbi:GntR family transcriptional regulator [Dactylosporangium maewongense]|uniref:GntR family transcriptional regulator n=1 Tax=Dactylosporangium maewongense TaxID=634393 RepID=UPI0031D7E79F
MSTSQLPASSSNAVYAELRSRFANGDYGPGQRLMEVALAADLGVSRTPVREAIGRLLAEGLVVPTARGVAVAALNEVDAAAIFVLRADLEGLAAQLAAERQAAGAVAPAVFDQLDKATDAVEVAVVAGDARAAARANLHLHRAIGATAGNAFLEDALHRVWDRIAVSTVSNLSDPVWAASITEQHRAIVSAIRAGDSGAARQAAVAHIEAAYRVLLHKSAGTSTDA